MRVVDCGESISAGQSRPPHAQRWQDTVPVMRSFPAVADPAHYAGLPDDWHIGVSDVRDSTGAIMAGRYKEVNLAGAGTISAVSNALAGKLAFFAFGGDGARFAVPPHHAEAAVAALEKVAGWADRELGLTLRIAMSTVGEVRAAGWDIRAAYWQVSDQLRYTMFTGGGLEWLESEMKRGRIGIEWEAGLGDPDLSGLSCQWGQIPAKQGNVVSLIVKQAPNASPTRFAEVTAEIVSWLEQAPRLNPVPREGPEVRWPGGTIGLQSTTLPRSGLPWLRHSRVFLLTVLNWLLFKAGIRLGRFDTDLYRREVAANTDFRKFDDGLMMTVDCSDQIVERLRAKLESARQAGIVRYGLHTQDEAVMTCVAPSVFSADHMHFVDGAGGGYAMAAKQLDN